MAKENKDKKEETVLTIHDFKVMIEGMDMVLGDDWYPTEAQWKRIRKKLDQIIDNVSRPVPAPNYNTNVALPGVPMDNVMSTFPQVPVAADIPIGEAPPTFQKETTLSDGSAGVKTPDIDTSGGYDSGFV